MKQIILIIFTILSLGLKAQFSVAPQISFNYGNFELGDFLVEPQQKKLFPSLGLRLNYQFNRVLISTDFNTSIMNEFNLIHSIMEFDPKIFAKLRNKDAHLSFSYNLIDNLFVGTGIKFLFYNNIETKRGFIDEQFEYTNSYALLCASYMIKKFSVELSMSRYLSLIGNSDINGFRELIRAPEIFSLKMGYNISFRK